ncbi:MAG: hypothetical protein Tsb0033_18110 [Winogradskyella sp.]
MKNFILLIVCILLTDCAHSKKVNLISLDDIDISEIQENNSCHKNFDWIESEYFHMFLKSLKEKNRGNFKKVVLVKYSHSGEVVENNSIALLYLKSNEVLILSFGMDFTSVKKKKIRETFSIEQFLTKLPQNGSFTQMHILEIADKKTTCYYKDKFSYKNYEAIQDLSFFSTL